MTDGKLTSIGQGVAPIENNSVVGVGGNINARRPVALALEIAAQGKQGLTLFGMTAGIACDLLVGFGCAAKLRSSYTGLEIFGFAPMFRKASERGELEVLEETEMTVAAGLRATLAGVGFMPARALAGTDLAALRDDIKTVVCPYRGEKLAAMPAVELDVAIIHALAADKQGNAILGGNLGVDIEMAQIAKRTVISAEEIISHEECVRRGVDIIGLSVDSVVHAPKGAWPSSCHPAYGLDGLKLIDYIAACQKGGFKEFANQLRQGLKAA